MAIIKRVKNNKATYDEWVNQGIEAGAYYTIQDMEAYRWTVDSKVSSDIDAGNLIINDGTSDITDTKLAKRWLQKAYDVGYFKEYFNLNAFCTDALTTATSASTLTLIENSTYLNIFTGSTSGQIVKLPSATTCRNGHRFEFINKATAAITIQNYDGTTIHTLAGLSAIKMILTDNSTTAGSWRLDYSLSQYYRIATTEQQLIDNMTELNNLGGGTIQFTQQIGLTADRSFNFNNIRWLGSTSNDTALKFNGYKLTISGGSAGNGGAYFQNFRFLGENSLATGYNQNIMNTDATNFPLYLYFDNCFFKNVLSKDTETYVDISGGNPTGVVLDVRNGATSVVFENCDVHSDNISDSSTTLRHAPLTIWARQGIVTRIRALGQYSTYTGRNRYRVMPPSGTASTGTYLDFGTDGTAVHYGAFPTVTLGTAQILNLVNPDTKQLHNITSGSTLDLTNPSTSYVSDGLWVIDATSATTSFTLPLVITASSGFGFVLYKKGSYACTINANTGQTLNGRPSYILSGADTFLEFYYDLANTNWVINFRTATQTHSTVTYGASNSLSTTTSTSWQTKVSFTTDWLPAASYKINCSYSWYYSSTSRQFQARIIVDGTTTVFSRLEIPRSTSTTNRHTGSGFAYITLTEGTHTVSLDYRTSNIVDTAGIDNAYLDIRRE